MFNKLFMVLFISFIFFSCSEETNQALETWETCSYIQGSYIKGLQLKCGEEIRKDHYNSIKTTFDEKGEHYYCKEKYKNYYGEVNFPTKSGKYHIPKIDWTKKEYTTSTCDELTPYIGTKLEEEVDLYIMTMSLDNVKSCNALNNIFIEELKFKCKEEADILIEKHKKAFEDNENYYCDKYKDTFVGKKWENSDKISFPKNRSYCVEGIEESSCDELKKLVAKNLEDEIIAYGYYISEDEERLKKYEKKCSILYIDEE